MEETIRDEKKFENWQNLEEPENFRHCPSLETPYRIGSSFSSTDRR